MDNIDTANRFSALINKKYKIVTLDGQVVNVGGSLTGGSKDKFNNSLSIRYELEENRKKCNIIEDKNKDIVKELSDIDKELNEINNKLYEYQNNKIQYETKKENIYITINKLNKDKEEKRK